MSGLDYGTSVEGGVPLSLTLINIGAGLDLAQEEVQRLVVEQHSIHRDGSLWPRNRYL